MSKKKKRKKSNENCFNIFSDTELPPCAQFLGDYNPLIRDGEIIYRNYNRLYFFLSYKTLPISEIVYMPEDPSTYTVSTTGNFQISIYAFLICIYINCIQKNLINTEDDIMIHKDEYADGFIKSVLNNPELNINLAQNNFSNRFINNNSETVASNKNIDLNQLNNTEAALVNNIDSNFIPAVSYVIANSNSIVPFYSGRIQISPINFYIILMLSRFENNYALLYGNNSYVSSDFINQELANSYYIFSNYNENFN